jgi:hypothetical protein
VADDQPDFARRRDFEEFIGADESQFAGISEDVFNEFSSRKPGPESESHQFAFAQRGEAEGNRFGSEEADGFGMEEGGVRAILDELRLIRDLVDDLPDRMADAFGVND